MAKKAKIELDILNPEKFKTLQEIRDFVTGDGASALHYAIYKALSPGGFLSEVDEFEVKLKDELKDARGAAMCVNNDLEALAKAAVESDGDPEVVGDRDFIKGKERLALMFIALKDGDADHSTQFGIIKYLGGSDTVNAHA